MAITYTVINDGSQPCPWAVMDSDGLCMVHAATKREALACKKECVQEDKLNAAAEEALDFAVDYLLEKFDMSREKARQLIKAQLE